MALKRERGKIQDLVLWTLSVLWNNEQGESFYEYSFWVLLHPTDYSKNVLCFLFLEQWGHYELWGNHLFTLPRGGSISNPSQGASSLRASVAGLAPPRASPNWLPAWGQRQERTEKFPLWLLAHQALGAHPLTGTQHDWEEGIRSDWWLYINFEKATWLNR